MSGGERIAEVRAFPLQYPEPHDGGRLRCITLVRVRTESGAVGWGEAISGSPQSSRAVALIVEEVLSELLERQDPQPIASHLERMRMQTFWYGTGGIATMGIAAVDMALWDLNGRVAGVPVHALLGGKLVDRVRLCASVIPDTEDLDATGEWFASFRERGFTAVKAGWGRKPAEAAFGIDPHVDLELARTIREAIGPEGEMSFDVSVYAGWSVDHAIDMARRLDPYKLAWLEDALEFDDFLGYARLREAAPMAIATGERLWRPNEYQRLFEAEAADIVLIDPGRVEGISGMKEAARRAATAGVQIVPHSWSSAVNTAAALHVYVSSPNGRVFEVKPDPSPMQHELVERPFEFTNGHLAVPDTPGLGIEVDEAVVKQYALE